MGWTRFLRRARWDRERARELDAYLDMETAENMARGMRPEEAQHAARRKLGNATRIREEIYGMNSIGFIETLSQDVRYGLRMLLRSPGFTTVVVLCLALGIGANTAIFSLIDAALVKMLPVRDPEQLVRFVSTNSRVGANEFFPYPAFKQYRDRNQVFSGVFAFSNLHNVDFEVNGKAGIAAGQAVSGDYFSTLGVRAVAGRLITAEDVETAGSSPVAVISYDYWGKRFARDVAAIGKKIILNGSPFTVIGVTAPEFFGLEPGEQIDVSIPVTMLAQVRPEYAAAGTPYDVLTAPYRNWVHIMARLKPAVTPAQAIANLAPIVQQTSREAADGLIGLPFDSPQGRHVFQETRLRFDPGSRGLTALRQRFSKPLFILMAAVGLLLLITCANVANLLLARAGARQREIAIRLALGAGRRRLLRQLITESAMLACMGGAAGLLLAWWGSGSLVAWMSHSSAPVSLSVRPDVQVLGFALAVSMAAALLFGIVPAWRASRPEVSPALTETARTLGARGRSRLAKGLVISQVALSLVLLIGAGLLSRSLEKLRDFYPGLHADSVLLFNVNPSMVGYGNTRAAALYQDVLERIHSIPGVRSTSLSVYGPFSTGFSFVVPTVEGYTPPAGKEPLPTGINIVGPDYFRTIGTPVLIGRDFTSADREGSPRVAIVNETMARRYFAGTNPIGRRFNIADYKADASWLQIVGVVKDSKYHDLREQTPAMAYVPFFQATESGGATFEVRTANNPVNVATAVRRAVAEADGRLPVFDLKTLRDQVEDSLVEERLIASLSSLFGALALLLACVGLYGLMAYVVSRKTNEIGLRMALGARRGQIVAMVLRETVLLVMGGLAVGIPAGLAASRLISSELYGVQTRDPLTILLATSILIAVAALAGFLPARRAALVDPMAALRFE
jgi:predicted permease